MAAIDRALNIARFRYGRVDGTRPAVHGARSIQTPREGRSTVKSLKYAVIAALVASTVTLQPVTALAQGRDRRDRYEDKRDRDHHDDQPDDERDDPAPSHSVRPR